MLHARRPGERFQGADGGEQLVLAAYVQEYGGDVVGAGDFFQPERVGDGAFGGYDAVVVVG